MNFGVVITLQEINGVNRIDEFIKQCFLKNWPVTPVNVENRIDIYNIAEGEKDRYPNAMKRWEENWDIISLIFKFSRCAKGYVHHQCDRKS